MQKTTKLNPVSVGEFAESAFKHFLWIFNFEGGERLVLPNIAINGADIQAALNDEECVKAYPHLMLWSTGFYIDGIDLSNSSFNGVNFYASQIKKANLANCDFSKCTFVGSRMKEALLTGSNFTDVIMRQVGFDYAQASKCTFSGSKIRVTSFFHANLAESHFSHVDLAGCDLSGADLRGTTFHNVDLIGACFKGANLTNASFVNVDLTAADFRGAIVNGMTADDCFFDRNMFSPGAVDVIRTTCQF